MTYKRYIDPPEGWKYGFPKPLPPWQVDIKEWLVEQGYPESIIQAYGDHFQCSFWDSNDDG